MVFYNREEETARLEEAYARPGFQLAVVWGRRRVGKTYLLRSFVKGKPHVFFTGTRTSELQQVAQFSEALEELLAHATPLAFDNWRRALGYVFETLGKSGERVVVVLDEYSDIEEVDPSVPGQLRALIDRYPEANLLLVLCGSAVRRMEKLSRGDQPLYGRAQTIFKVSPFGFREAELFMEGRPFAGRVAAYGVAGGMPMYLAAASGYTTIEAFLRAQVINTTGAFFEEGNTVIGQEMREPGKFFAVLDAIAAGNTRLSKISSALGIKQTTVHPYLSRLETIEVIKRVVPATESNPRKSKKGQYLIRDNFIRFWFKYVHPNSGRIEGGEADLVLRKTLEDLDNFLGKAGEEVTREALLGENRKGRLPFEVRSLGKYWDNNVEIDICGVGQGRQFLWGECKWQRSQVGPGLYHQLKEKVARAGFGEAENHYVFCSKSGFTKKMLKLAEEEALLLYGPEELERAIRGER